MLPDSVIAPLRLHLEQVKVQHQNDLALGLGSVSMPFGLGENIPLPTNNGSGNTFFQQHHFIKTQKMGSVQTVW